MATVGMTPVLPTPSASRSSGSSSTTGKSVSYELFAPRSSSQVSRLSRIAALTAGPAALAASTQKSNSSTTPKQETSLLHAMSPERSQQTPTASSSNSYMESALTASDDLTTVLKHATSLRLALRASINIAEDISNRHSDLIRHSGELSAAADRLQQEQALLTNHAHEIGMPLQHYDAVDQIGVLVGVLFKGKTVVRGLAKLKVDNDEFVSTLDKVDEAVSFFGRESGGKQVLEDELKRRQKSSKVANNSHELSGNIEYFRRSLALQDAALFLIKEAVVDRISTTTQQVTDALNLAQKPVAADRLEASLVYTRFHGISSRSNRLLALVRKRLHHGDAYHELLSQCRNTFCKSRQSLLKGTVRAHMEALKAQHGLVGMTRLASVFLIRLCTVETSLYLDFFGDKKQAATPEEDGDDKKDKDATSTTISKQTKSIAPQLVAEDGTYHDSEFQQYLATLCTELHRTVRRGIVTLLDLDTLCQIVSVLREERSMATASPTTMAAARAISAVIEDAQERLIYCATGALTKEVIRFKATPSDLNYPDKLMKKKDETKGESTATEDDLIQQQLLVYESWFPPMRSVLRILSKIFRVVEPKVFEDIALRSVNSCIKCLKDGAKYILKRRGILDGDLFLVKHLLILREQLSPFDIDLRSVERQLDFSDAGKAVSRFLANRNRRLFSMTTENALVTLLREGVSMKEESVDSKRDLEEALRSACNEFIDHTCHSIVSPIMKLVEKLHSGTTEHLSKDSALSGPKVKTALESMASDEFTEASENVVTKMALYLENSATQTILMKPISKKVSKSLEEIRKFACATEEGGNGWDETIRGEILVAIDSLQKLLKASLSSSR